MFINATMSHQLAEQRMADLRRAAAQRRVSDHQHQPVIRTARQLLSRRGR